MTLDWPTVPEASAYRLQVSLDSSFTRCIVDKWVSVSEEKISVHPPPSGCPLSFFWRVTVKDLLGNNWNATIWKFTMRTLWERLSEIPIGVAGGASLAYASNGYYRDIYAFPGNDSRSFYRFRVDQWGELNPLPEDEERELYQYATDGTGLTWGGVFDPDTLYATPYYETENDDMYELQQYSISSGNWHGWGVRAVEEPNGEQQGAGSAIVFYRNSIYALLGGLDVEDNPNFGRFYRATSKSSSLSENNLSSSQTISCYPNPFTERISISYSSRTEKPKKITIYDLSGKKVRDLITNANSSLYWDGTDNKGRKLSPGVYIIRLENTNRMVTLKAIIDR